MLFILSKLKNYLNRLVNIIFLFCLNKNYSYTYLYVTKYCLVGDVARILQQTATRKPQHGLTVLLAQEELYTQSLTSPV